MCTFILGHRVLPGGGSVIATNRDEDPRRPSIAPHVIRERPHVVGGLDTRAEGTWLGIRDRRAVVALLNARPDIADALPEPPGRPFRSRGLLTLDALVAGGPATGSDAELGHTVFAHARDALVRDPYRPCSLIFAAPDTAWLLAVEPERAIEATPFAPGWHVVTPLGVDQPGDPRTAWLLEELRARAGALPADLDGWLLQLLGTHAPRPGAPGAVCVHEGGRVTVSSALVHLRPTGVRFAYVAGRPCDHAPVDYSHLVAGGGRP